MLRLVALSLRLWLPFRWPPTLVDRSLRLRLRLALRWPTAHVDCSLQRGLGQGWLGRAPRALHLVCLVWASLGRALVWIRCRRQLALILIWSRRCLEGGLGGRAGRAPRGCVALHGPLLLSAWSKAAH